VEENPFARSPETRGDLRRLSSFRVLIRLFWPIALFRGFDLPSFSSSRLETGTRHLQTRARLKLAFCVLIPFYVPPCCNPHGLTRRPFCRSPSAPLASERPRCAPQRKAPSMFTCEIVLAAALLTAPNTCPMPPNRSVRRSFAAQPPRHRHPTPRSSIRANAPSSDARRTLRSLDAPGAATKNSPPRPETRRGPTLPEPRRSTTSCGESFDRHDLNTRPGTRSDSRRRTADGDRREPIQLYQVWDTVRDARCDSLRDCASPSASVASRPDRRRSVFTAGQLPNVRCALPEDNETRTEVESGRVTQSALPSESYPWRRRTDCQIRPRSRRTAATI